MNEEQLVLLTVENQEVNISVSDVKRIQGYIGAHTSETGGMSMISGSYQYIELKTETSTFKIARNALNDSQLLTFMLSDGKRAT